MRRRRPSLTLLLAGWLFADMLLALTIVMLGAQAPPKAAAEAKPSPSKTPCVEQLRGVDQRPMKTKFAVRPAARGRTLVTQVKRGLNRHADDFAGKRVGMVLTFGGDGGGGRGVALAARVNRALRNAYPSAFESAATRNFHDLSASRGSIAMEIYFINDGCAEEGPAS